MNNPFFKNKGPYNISQILTSINFDKKIKNSKKNISDIKDLVNASNKDITFFHSKKYESVASSTNTSFISLSSVFSVKPYLRSKFGAEIGCVSPESS